MNTLPVIQDTTPRGWCCLCELLVILMLPFVTEAGSTTGDPGRDRLRYVQRPLSAVLDKWQKTRMDGGRMDSTSTWPWDLHGPWLMSHVPVDTDLLLWPTCEQNNVWVVLILFPPLSQSSSSRQALMKPSLPPCRPSMVPQGTSLLNVWCVLGGRRRERVGCT